MRGRNGDTNMKRQSIVWFFSMPIFAADNDAESLGNHGVDVRSRVYIVMSCRDVINWGPAKPGGDQAAIATRVASFAAARPT